jgi:hypothetical protein
MCDYQISNVPDCHSYPGLTLEVRHAVIVMRNSSKLGAL